MRDVEDLAQPVFLIERVHLCCPFVPEFGWRPMADMTVRDRTYKAWAVANQGGSDLARTEDLLRSEVHLSHLVKGKGKG